MLSASAKPLPDFTSLCGTVIAFLEPLQTFTSLRAATVELQMLVKQV